MPIYPCCHKLFTSSSAERCRRRRPNNNFKKGKKMMKVASSEVKVVGNLVNDIPAVVDHHFCSGRTLLSLLCNILTKHYSFFVNLYQLPVNFSCDYIFCSQKSNNWADFFARLVLKRVTICINLTTNVLGARGWNFEHWTTVYIIKLLHTTNFSITDGNRGISTL